MQPTADSSSSYFVHSKSTQNFWNMIDPQLDEWADEAHREPNTQTRRAIQKKEWGLIQDRVFKFRIPGQLCDHAAQRQVARALDRARAGVFSRAAATDLARY